jgi:hypothetical protein
MEYLVCVKTLSIVENAGLGLNRNVGMPSNAISMRRLFFKQPRLWLIMDCETWDISTLL